MQKITLFLIMLAGALTSNRLSAQSIGPSAIDAAGASVTIGGVSHEYAIGQVMAGNTLTAGSLIITPDVLQPSFSTGVKGTVMSTDALKVFPSPAASTLFVKPAFSGAGVLKLHLYDEAGKLVTMQEVRLSNGDEQQTMELSSFATGNYMLQAVWNGSEGLQTAGFKIQKIK